MTDSIVTRTDKWPKLLHQTALHGLAGQIVSLIEPHTEADPAAILIQLLVAFGNVIGRSAHWKVESDTHHLNLFAVLAGQSSKARKGTSWGHVRRLLGEVDPDWEKARIQDGLSSGEGLIWAVRDGSQQPLPPVGGKAQGTDPGVEDKRLLIMQSEFASVLSVIERDGNTLSATLRNAWDTGDLRILTKNSPACASGAPHITDWPHHCRRIAQVPEVNGGSERVRKPIPLALRETKQMPSRGRESAGTQNRRIGAKSSGRGSVCEQHRARDERQRNPGALGTSLPRIE